MRIAFCGTVANAFDLDVFNGVRRALTTRGDAHLVSYLWREQIPPKALSYVELDGVLVGAHTLDELPEKVRGLPLLGFSNAFADPGFPRVINDDREAGRLAARALIQAGYQHLVTYEAQVHHAVQRVEGFLEITSSARIPVTRNLVEIRKTRAGETFEDVLQEHTRALAESVRAFKPNTGVYSPLGMYLPTIRDLILSETQLALADGVGLIAGDLLGAEYADLDLAHVKLEGERVGRMAASLLCEMIGGARGGVAERSEVRPTRVVRGSTLRCDESEQLLNAIAAYCEPRLEDRIQVADIARHVGMSRRAMELHLKQKGLPTPYEQLTRMRLRRAEKLLLTTDLSIERISEMCGFTEMRSFTKRFRHERGCPPSQFRRAHLRAPKTED